MSTDWVATGRALREARKKRNLTVLDLADMSNLSTKTIYNAETGLAQMTPRTVQRLEAALRVTGLVQEMNSPAVPPTFFDSNLGENLVMTHVRVERKGSSHYIAIDSGVEPDVFLMAASAAEAVIVASKKTSKFRPRVLDLEEASA
jgi:transcriptional regulator with XRE-family HTH domain